MLHVPAPFPHAGSEGYVVPDGARARILRDNGDGTCLVAFAEPRAIGTAEVESRDHLATKATGNRTEPKANLFETRMAALEEARRRARGGSHMAHENGAPRQSRKARRPSRRKATA